MPFRNQTPEKTCNTDVLSLVRRTNRVIVELIKSQSSATSYTNNFDIERVKQYVVNLRTFTAWMVSQPLLDLPETGPEPTELPKSPDIPELENESIYDLCCQFAIARDELSNSQSARNSTNLIQHDHRRWISYLDKIDSFVDNHILQSEPLDLPESSPMMESTGKGLQGI